MGARKAPEESATKFKVGTTRRGNDGNMYVIRTYARTDGKRIKRWFPKSSKKTTTTKKKAAAPAKKAKAPACKGARKVPAVAASTVKVGARRKGCDGKMYVVSDKHRWAAVAKKAPARKSTPKKKAPKAPKK
jgi:hypothetical protein